MSVKQHQDPCSGFPMDSTAITGSAFQISFQPVGKLTNGFFLTGQSWHILNSWYTGGAQNKDFGIVSQMAGTNGGFCDSAHQDCKWRTFHGSFGRMQDFKKLRCNLVHFGRLNLANAWLPYQTCNTEIFNKPQKKGPGPPGPTPKSALGWI